MKLSCKLSVCVTTFALLAMAKHACGFRSTDNRLLASPLFRARKEPSRNTDGNRRVQQDRLARRQKPTFSFLHRKAAKKTAALPLYSSAGVSGDSKRSATAESIDRGPLLEKLRKLSNIASVLCVLDCTILPIITVALPLLGFLQLAPAQLELIHHLGHQLALYFVLPVGGLTSVINFISHRKKWITAMAAVGLCMVGLANSHLHSLPFVGHVHWLHDIHHGPLHRLVNISGCALLLSSNYLSQRQGCAFHTDCSSHVPDGSRSLAHSHSHSHHDHDNCNHNH